MDFLIVLTCVSIVAPVVIWLCYSIIPIKIETEISADGMLGYCGSVISGTLSLFVAGIALYQSKKARDFEEEKSLKQRREQIKPCLQLIVEKADKSIFKLTIQNISSNSAIGVYLYEYLFLPIVKGNSKATKKFTVNGKSTVLLNIDEFYCEFSKTGYPKNINLIYADIDNNLISEDYTLNSDDAYIITNIEYMN